MSVVNIASESLAEWKAGHGTVGTAAAALSNSMPVRKYVVIRANASNSGTITIGPTALQADDGFILAAGDTTPPIYVNDLAKVFLIGSDADQAYSWMSF